MSTHTPQILVVDDDPEIRKLLARYIEGQAFRVLLASSCRELRERIATNKIDLIVLDVMLPDGSGLDACRDLKAERNTIPIILLTALKEDIDRIVGLEMGADDYLGKPFNPRELVARIRAVLRRRSETTSQAPTSKVYQFEGLIADPQTRSVVDPQGNAIELTGAEFDLLQTFLDRPGRVLSRDQLLDLTHGRDGGDVLDRSIDVLISRLRRKLDASGATRLFKTVRNGGYQLVVKVELQDSPS
ncbi:response regulator transcription factor [Pseudorhodoplanes sinuspersici]|uniref:Regulatory protein VirG n=1 Tax=Pseudorhodoplanes sinuspersici TaxID=1235591 RepID=A0A1W6ZMQ1_9HYPH|nr:response regulator transcription factor [Pseudorhodoplanes sinuspersici]ARP98517.1 DNA-binding response regulator [Pseudorhodoplanes sinuspersici]RKE65893.1 winged helix family two component transcriptional regulator [Pseudorhodoplanes sinuspersici]